MPLRPFGLPTFSVRSRVTVEIVIMDPAEAMCGVSPLVIERVREVFIDRLYGVTPAPPLRRRNLHPHDDRAGRLLQAR